MDELDDCRVTFRRRKRRTSELLIDFYILCTSILLFSGGVKSQFFSKVNVPVGLKAKLLCSTEITGNIDVQWLDPSGTTLAFNAVIETGDSRFKVDRTYLKEWNLVIENVRQSDAGNYTCSIGPRPIISKVVELGILVAPSITSSSHDDAYQIGSLVTLTCDVKGVPPPSITWARYTTKTGQKIDLEVDGRTYSMSVTYEDAGIYECLASNGVAPSVVSKMRVDVVFPPQINVLYRVMSQEEGASTLMTCLIISNPSKDLYWERNGQRVIASHKYGIQKWDVGEYQTTLGLFINRLVAADFGDYKCIAQNEFGRAEEKITIYEYQTGDIRIVSVPKDSLASVGDDVQLDCSVHGLAPGDSLIWWHNHPDGQHQKIFISNPVSVERESSVNMDDVYRFDSEKYEIRGHYNLYIRDVDFNDSGTYTCEIMRHQNYSIELTVVDNHLSCENNKSQVSDGEPVELVCMLSYRGVAPNVQILWSHDDEQIPSIATDSDDRIQRTLQLIASYPESTGIYQCIVSGRQQNFSATCRTDVTVLSSKADEKLHICEDRLNSTQPTDDLSSALIIIILSAIVGLLLVSFIITVCCLVTCHRQDLAKYKHYESKENSTKNGGTVDIEQIPLTTARLSSMSSA